MWKKLFLKQQHACFLMPDCSCSRGCFGLSSCLIALCSPAGFIAKDKIGKFQDMAWATCPFPSLCLIHPFSPLLNTGFGGIICQKMSLKLRDIATYLDYHVAINLLMLILLA